MQAPGQHSPENPPGSGPGDDRADGGPQHRREQHVSQRRAAPDTALAISAIFEDIALDPPVRVQILTSIGEIEIVADRHAIETRLGHVLSPDASLAGPHELILGTLAGEISLAAAEDAGLAVSGSRPALHRLITARR